MTIISLILVGVLSAYQQATRTAARDTTRTALREVISRAFSEYVATNRRYPCPANPALLPNDPLYGREGTCSGTGTIVFGAIPTAALKLPEKYMLDGWSRQYTYAITRALTVGPIQPSQAGIINMINVQQQVTVNPTTLEVSQTGNITQAAPVNSSGAVIRFQAVVVSAGDNGRGARTASGVITDPCPTTGVIPLEARNCNGGNTFIRTVESGAQDHPSGDAFRLLGNAANYYDDLVLAISAPSLPIWQYSPQVATGDDLFTKAAAVGVGVQNPDTQLHVSGNVRADHVRTNTICSLTDTSECFNPNIIGGSVPAMSCGTAPLVGIERAAAVCATTILTNRPAARCASGQYVIGFDASGNIICG